MEFVATLDPELAPGVEQFPAEPAVIAENPAAAREIERQMAQAAFAAMPPTDVKIETQTIAGPDGDLKVVIYQPPNPAPRPAMLWMHGGGHIIGMAEDHAICLPLAETVGCTIVSVEYPLSPEATYMAAIEASFAALNWMVDQADELGIDAARLAIGGGSAGGGLAAGLALYNRDNNGPEIAFQLLIYPMLDDTHDTPSGHFVTHPKVWNRDVSLKAWQMYLGDEYGTDHVSPYAAPSRATDLTGLPPAYLTVGTADLFRDEDIDYAQRLMAAGVPTELEVFYGMFHAGELTVPTAAVSQRMISNYTKALKRALAQK
ncbi:MAG: alpha/beta hydrolase [Chloroflexi bacterium]|nr:alpha/beta hydrolase [Chloroflexota bacterium]